jgi:uncharacterized damage-inducible protein DinB
MELLDHYRMLARYNRIANERLYQCCAQLDDTEYRRKRLGSFGSVHALLNHILLGDRIWMSRFKGGGRTTPALVTILFDNFPDLRSARETQDADMESFFGELESGFLDWELCYTNSQGRECREKTSVAVTHLFNHQTHHRGQIHVMLSQTSVPPPSLDLYRIINP